MPCVPYVQWGVAGDVAREQAMRSVHSGWCGPRGGVGLWFARVAANKGMFFGKRDKGVLINRKEFFKILGPHTARKSHSAFRRCVSWVHATPCQSGVQGRRRHASLKHKESHMQQRSQGGMHRSCQHTIASILVHWPALASDAMGSSPLAGSAAASQSFLTPPPPKRAFLRRQAESASGRSACIGV